mmetsp:Transcript_1518/g.2519  ORF Transcript_1518/g.2519 Transcript_1518/m.2519 type:complete len:84 (-) Transcript_1518:69-320(-)
MEGQEQYRKYCGKSFVAGDGVKIYFDEYRVSTQATEGEAYPGQNEEMHGTQNLLLLHGWSGSGRYYSPAVHALLEDENLLRKR